MGILEKPSILKKLSDIDTSLGENVQQINTNTANIALKVDKTYVDTKFGSMGSTKTFKGSCTDTELLAKTGMVVDDYWYITDLATNKCYNGTSWVDIGNNLNIGNKSIAAEKTNFLGLFNLFNKNDLITGGYYNGSGVWTANAGFNASNFIPVDYNETYITNVVTSHSNIIFFNSSGSVVSVIAANSWTGQFTVPNNSSITQMKFAFTTSENLDVLMLIKGSTLPDIYSPYGKYSFSDNTITVQEKDIKLTTISKNLFNKNKVTTGYEVYSDGTFKVEANSAITEYIKVSGSSLFISGLTAYATSSLTGRFCRFYDVNKAALGSNIIILKADTEACIPIPTGAVYFVMSIYQRKTSAETINLDTIQIELNSRKTAYVPYVSGISKFKDYSVGKDAIVDFVNYPTTGKNLLIFGDSITETATVSDDGATYTEGTRSNWVTFSKAALQIGQLWNYAKSGAAYRDRVGVLERQKISVQITTAIANNRPGDIIVISCGTNDGSTNLGDYATAMGKSTLADLDRTLLYEAIRWAFWTLRTNYPNAICFAATPIQRADYEQPVELIDAITKMAHRYNFIIIDAYNESGIVRDFEVNSGAGRYLSDGLHPATNGQMLMSKLYDRVIFNSLNY